MGTNIRPAPPTLHTKTHNTQDLMNHHLALQQTWASALHGQLTETSSQVTSPLKYKFTTAIKCWHVAQVERDTFNIVIISELASSYVFGS